MSRLFAPTLALLLLTSGLADAAPPSGLWKLRLTLGSQPVTFLLNFAQVDGKWVGDFISASLPLREEPKIADVAVEGTHLKFGVRLRDQEVFSFDGIISENGGKITGTLASPASVPQLTELRPSKLKTLDDPFTLARENFDQAEVGPDLFNTGFVVIRDAAEKKLTEEAVRAIADRMTKAAAEYGPRWERTVALQLASELVGQKGMAEVALAQARRAERMLTENAPVSVSLAVMEAMAKALEKADKPDEAKKYRTLAARLELREFAELQKSNPLAEEAVYSGRKGSSDRAVLVEIFTSAEMPESVSFDMIQMALGKTFKPSEVVVLSYQVHAPTANPLAARESLERARFYVGVKVIRGLPAVVIDGKAAAVQGGEASTAKTTFATIRKQIEDQLEKPSPVKLTLAATAMETGWTAKATVADLEKPGEKMTLRFALIESRIRYDGISGSKYHLNVVRSLPGGEKGFPLKEKSAEQSVTINPAELRTTIQKDQDEFVSSQGIDFPTDTRPLALTNLKLVAFVQDDETGDVLQAVEIPLTK